MNFDFDLFVIGGGSGGVRAARVAAGENGAKVGLAEESRYGGTCVIRGCVPKKLMVFASGYAGIEAEAGAYGWDVTLGDFNWDRFKVKLHAELDRLEGIYRRLLSNSGVETFDQRATVKDAHTVVLADGTEKTAKHILVAVGGRPTRPDTPGAELGIVSDDLFDLPELPKSILIVGGGYIASEFAGVLNGLGTKVTQFYRGDQILRGFDDEARGLVAEQMIEKGIDLQVNTNVADMEKREGGIWVKSTNGDEALFDQVLFATGRAPNTDGLGLEALGVALDKGGAVEVTPYSQTAVPSIYAIGDVTNRVNLTPVAIREGMAFVETVFKSNPTPVDHDLIPSAIFTQPEMGTVGMGEEEAAALERVEIYATTFKPMQSSFAGRPDRVLMKLVVSEATRKVLGCHIVAPAAGEMIQLAGIAVKMGATKEDFDRTVAVHPTMSEEIVTMKTPTRVVG
ncbi:glutathione-disulfide reductase [Ascidiaceihabitans sp.]|uniref:glutathione-disulfide reductase n=1 Tax=Ascidiaceihabitans sp. TaxID=1872644 RepID=UPI00329A2E99